MMPNARTRNMTTRLVPAISGLFDKPVKRTVPKRVALAVRDLGNAVLASPGIAFVNSPEHKALMRAIRRALDDAVITERRRAYGLMTGRTSK